MNFQEYQISTDNLTGLNNRRCFDNYLQKVSINKHDEFVYLFLIDINDFKGINDVYGHVNGDKALSYVGRKLKECNHNKNIFAARYGGDEFAVIYHCNNEQDAKALKQKITQVIEKDNANSFDIKVSIGMSKIDPNTYCQIEQLIESADQELYKEKIITKKADS